MSDQTKHLCSKKRTHRVAPFVIVSGLSAAVMLGAPHAALAEETATNAAAAEPAPIVQVVDTQELQSRRAKTQIVEQALTMEQVEKATETESSAKTTPTAPETTQATANAASQLITTTDAPAMTAIAEDEDAAAAEDYNTSFYNGSEYYAHSTYHKGDELETIDEGDVEVHRKQEAIEVGDGVETELYATDASGDRTNYASPNTENEGGKSIVDLDYYQADSFELTFNIANKSDEARDILQIVLLPSVYPAKANVIVDPDRAVKLLSSTGADLTGLIDVNNTRQFNIRTKLQAGEILTLHVPLLLTNAEDLAPYTNVFTSDKRSDYVHFNQYSYTGGKLAGIYGLNLRFARQLRYAETETPVADYDQQYIGVTRPDYAGSDQRTNPADQATAKVPAEIQAVMPTAKTSDFMFDNFMGWYYGEQKGTPSFFVPATQDPRVYPGAQAIVLTQSAKDALRDLGWSVQGWNASHQFDGNKRTADDLFTYYTYTLSDKFYGFPFEVRQVISGASEVTINTGEAWSPTLANLVIRDHNGAKVALDDARVTFKGADLDGTLQDGIATTAGDYTVRVYYRSQPGDAYEASLTTLVHVLPVVTPEPDEPTPTPEAVPTPPAPTPTPAPVTPAAPVVTPAVVVTPAATPLAAPAATPAAPAAPATAVIPPVATPLAGPTDAAPAEEAVADDETPLATPVQEAAVRWLLVLGALVTSLYGALVLSIRSHDASKLHAVYDRVTGNDHAVR